MYTAHLEAICFSGHHQMLLWGGTLPEQVWTGLHLSPPDVPSRDIPRSDITYYWHVNRQMPVKTLPSRNFVCGSNNQNIVWKKGTYSLITETRSRYS